jgi:nicotinamidase-related amidase
MVSPKFGWAALVVVDVQRDTLDGEPFEVPGTSAMLPNLRRLIMAFRAAGRPVVHMVRIYKPDGSNVDLSRRETIKRGRGPFLQGSDGSQIAQGLLPRDGLRLDDATLLAGGIQHIGPTEVIMYKPRWGAFFKTPLERHLRELEVTTIVFSGCNYPNCPRASIYEASERDFHITLVEDALSGFYDIGRAEMRNIGVRLMTTDAVVDAMRHVGPET